MPLVGRRLPSASAIGAGAPPDPRPVAPFPPSTVPPCPERCDALPCGVAHRLQTPRSASLRPALLVVCQASFCLASHSSCMRCGSSTTSSCPRSRNGCVPNQAVQSHTTLAFSAGARHNPPHVLPSPHQSNASPPILPRHTRGVRAAMDGTARWQKALHAPWVGLSIVGFVFLCVDLPLCLLGQMKDAVAKELSWAHQPSVAARLNLLDGACALLHQPTRAVCGSALFAGGAGCCSASFCARRPPCSIADI